MKRLLTIPECMKILRCSEKTCRRLIGENELQGCKVRASMRIVASSVSEYIERQVLAYLDDGLDDF